MPRTTNFHEISLDFESETIFHFCVDFLKQQMLYTRVVATGVEEQQQTFIFVFSYSNKHRSVQEGWNMVSKLSKTFGFGAFLEVEIEMVEKCTPWWR